jgi:hypothetical protein
MKEEILGQSRTYRGVLMSGQRSLTESKKRFNTQTGGQMLRFYVGQNGALALFGAGLP